MVPETCGGKCRCYYLQDEANVFNCSHVRLHTLPEETDVPNNTDWQDFSYTQLTSFHANKLYLGNILSLNLSHNNITEIIIENVQNLRNVKTLDLSYNRLKYLPKIFTSLKGLTNLWLRNNSFVCDCDTRWIKTWMENFLTSATATGVQVVQDYDRIRCDNGMLIKDSDPVEMGCYPKELTLWQKILIGLSAFVTIAIVIGIIAISRRWDEVQWLMFLHFNVLNKKDEKENNFDGIESDAFVSHR